MNKLKYIALGLGLGLLCSCSEDKNLPDNGKPNELTRVSFSVKLPANFETRSLGTGANATDLYAFVYDSSSNTFVQAYTFKAQFAENNNTTEINIDFMSGKSYQVVFFAGAPEVVSISNNEAVYYLEGSTNTLTVNYSAMTSEGNSDDSYDCFYAVSTLTDVSNSGGSIGVSLKRPVGQINWGTTDLSTVGETYGPNGAYIESRLVGELYTTLDLLTGEVGGNTSNVEMPPFSILSNETYPTNVAGVAYLAAQYILAPAPSTDITLNLWVSNAGDPNNSAGPYDSVYITVAEAPIQANYQTNIYGDLLTGQTNVSISKSEWTSGYNADLHWDGETVTYPNVEDSSTPVMIEKASDLAGLAEMVAGTAEGKTPNDFKGFTFTLAADFDMGGNEFKGIGSAVRSGSGTNSDTTPFRGTFDGNGNTISNLVITGSDNPNDAAGFIGNLDGEGVIKNVTFSNMKIDAPNNEQAGVVGIVTNGATVDGVTVTSGSVYSSEAAGGIVGRVLLSGTVTNCENSATVTSAVKNAGGIIGAAYYSEEGSTMTVSNCKNHGAVSGSGQAVAGIVGLSAADVSGCTNDGAITGIGANAVGGIVGQQNYAGSITGCSNSGEITGGTGSTNYGTGGIVGWVRYTGSSAQAYSRQNVISVTKCSNSASISGYTGVGGIVGAWYACGVCDYNSNTAPSLTAAGNFVAGIVGGSQWTEAGPTLAGTEGTETLYVQYNYSTTSAEEMSGGSKALYVYINDASKTIDSENSQTDPDVVNQ